MTFSEALICNHMQTEVCANRTKNSQDPFVLLTSRVETVTDDLARWIRDEVYFHSYCTFNVQWNKSHGSVYAKRCTVRIIQSVFNSDVDISTGSVRKTKLYRVSKFLLFLE